VVLAALLYVVLDLSCTEVQGAFVFDAGESVEGIDASRTRLAVPIVSLPASPVEALPVSPLSGRASRPAPPSTSSAPQEHPAVHCVTGAACDPAGPSEDPD
jgi:hypothetical protein